MPHVPLRYALLGALLLPFVASADTVRTFPPQWTFDDGTSVSFTSNLAWDLNHRDHNAGEDRQAHGWRRQEVGLVVRKSDVFDLHIHNDLHNKMWLGVALGVFTPSFIAPGKSGKVELGNFKIAAGMEAVAPTRHMPFMENSTATQVFHPLARTGINWTQTSDRWLLDIGVFGNDVEDMYRGDTQLLRMAWTPSSEHTKAHVGIALTRDVPRRGIVASYPDSGSVRWVNRGVASLLPDRLATSGTLTGVDVVNRQNLQGAWIRGQAWLQSEYFFQQTLRQMSLPDYRSHGGYLSAGWVFNAPPRRIVRGMLMQPAVPQGQVGGEIVARVGHVDLNDHGITGGKLGEWTVGATAYVGPYLKLQANVSQSYLDRNSAHHRLRAVQLRTQVFF